MPAFSMPVLSSLVEEINSTHDLFSNSWLNNQETKVNLKTKRINHIIDSEKVIALDFLNIINSYHSELLSLYTTTDFEFDYVDYEIRTRIKQKDSIINKLIQYRIDNSEGKISINKCLNDMFGVRIIFDDLDHECPEFNACLKLLEEEYCLKVVKRNLEGYSATHLYFKNESNFKFPWELQIWSKQDERYNIDSHKEHKSKRKYTTWPEVYSKRIELERSETI